MPGYMMHLCEGSYIISYILNKIKLTGFSPDTPIARLLSSQITDSASENQFLLGTVLPDAVSDKSKTHFRPAWQNDLITKYPDMSYITGRYPYQGLTAADLGVLAHLHMDSLYVEEFWPKYFAFEDSDNNPTSVSANIDHVRMTALSMQNSGSCIPIKSFFSDKYFYGDYNITNPLFKTDFSPRIPTPTPVQLSISECSSFSQTRLLQDLSFFISAPESPGLQCNVFPYKDLKDFIIYCAEQFFYLYTM